MISSQHHPQNQGQDYGGSSTTEAYQTDSTSAAEEQEQQDYQQEHNTNRCMMLLHDMQGQIEFYFGVNNYTRDVFLQQVVATHHGSVPISVIAQNPTGMGQAAAELLFARLENSTLPPRQIVIATQLLIRGSGEIPAL